LREMQCHFAQGFHFSRAIDAEKIAAFFTRTNA
jgi:EAL domain-containing protein (putative c-di-GMP-specific phosphodiesterase class I)